MMGPQCLWPHCGPTCAAETHRPRPSLNNQRHLPPARGSNDSRERHTHTPRWETSYPSGHRLSAERPADRRVTRDGSSEVVALAASRPLASSASAVHRGEHSDHVCSYYACQSGTGLGVPIRRTCQKTEFTVRTCERLMASRIACCPARSATASRRAICMRPRIRRRGTLSGQILPGQAPMVEVRDARRSWSLG